MQMLRTILTIEIQNIKHYQSEYRGTHCPGDLYSITDLDGDLVNDEAVVIRVENRLM